MEIQKWCQPHWDALRATVEARGLGHLVSRGGAAAAAHVADELRLGNAHDREGFDPLLRAWAMISGRALDNGVSPVGCPLCHVQRHHDECQQPGCFLASAQDWIDGCTESLRQYAMGLGLTTAETGEA